MPLPSEALGFARRGNVVARRRVARNLARAAIPRPFDPIRAEDTPELAGEVLQVRRILRKAGGLPVVPPPHLAPRWSSVNIYEGEIRQVAANAIVTDLASFTIPPGWVGVITGIALQATEQQGDTLLAESAFLDDFPTFTLLIDGIAEESLVGIGWAVGSGIAAGNARGGGTPDVPRITGMLSMPFNLASPLKIRPTSGEAQTVAWRAEAGATVNAVNIGALTVGYRYPEDFADYYAERSD